MPRRYRVRLFSVPRTAQVAALVVGFFPVITSAQQPRPYDAPSYDSPAAPSDQSQTIPAHLAIVDGEAWLERDGDVERATENVALLAGDRIRTANGRAEILFAEGSVLDIDRGTTIALLSESLLGLERGQVRLTLARAPAGVDYRIDGAGATAWIRAAGEYRVAVVLAESADADLRLTVIRGMAELASPHGRTAVRTGYEAVTTAETIPSLPYTVSVTLTDPFERWAYERHAERIGVTSAQYLPEPVAAYSGVLDQYGAWQYERPYGYVWYPRVASGWRPYYDGHWSFGASFGWFWVGGSRWSWPTHHFGRWGFNTRWYWVPGRAWAPAWVSWAYAPGFVSWCPLGFDNRAVVSITNVNVFNSHWRRAWTVLPSQTFVRNVVVRQYALSAQTALPIQTRFAPNREPSAPTVRTAAARRPLGAPTSVQTSAISRAGVADRTVAAPASSRTAAARSASGIVRAPLDSGRAPARAAAPVRADRPAASAPVDLTDRGVMSRSAAARRAPAAGAVADLSPRDDRGVAVMPQRGARASAPDNEVTGAQAPAVERATPRRAVPSRSRAIPDTAPERLERAGPSTDSRADRPASVWEPPASRSAVRRASPAMGAPAAEDPVDRGGETSAPASRARSRSSGGPDVAAPAPAALRPEPPASAWGARSRPASAPAASAPSSAPAARPSRPAATSSDGASGSRPAGRSAPASTPSQSSGRQRPGARR